MALEKLEWLDISEGGISDSGRMRQLVSEPHDPSHQRPSTFLFFGNKEKHLALGQLFPRNKIKVPRGYTQLYIDNQSIASDFPIPFASSSPDGTPASVKLNGDPPPIDWLRSAEFHSMVHGRLFALFTDVLCLFASDFPSADEVIRLLRSLAKAGCPSNFQTIRPKVVIVSNGISSSLDHFDIIKERLETLEFLRGAFSSMKVVRLTV